MSDIITDSIVMREFSADDISGIRKWAADSHTLDMLGGVWSKDMDDTILREYIDSFVSGDAGGLNYVICTPESRDYLGQISLFMIDGNAGKAEIAIVLIPEARGKGIASKAIITLCETAFRDYGLNKIYLSVDASNTPAVRCYRSCGFIVEGRLKDDRYIRHEYHDTLLMALFS